MVDYLRFPSWTKDKQLLVLLAATMMLVFFPVRGDSQSAGKSGGIEVPIRFEQGQVYAKLVGQPLVNVLEAMEEQGAIQVQGHERIPDYEVYGEFKGVPLADVLKRVLAPFNYALLPKVDGRPSKLILMSVTDQPISTLRSDDALSKKPLPEDGQRATKSDPPPLSDLVGGPGQFNGWVTPLDEGVDIPDQPYGTEHSGPITDSESGSSPPFFADPIEYPGGPSEADSPKLK